MGRHTSTGGDLPPLQTEGSLVETPIPLLLHRLCQRRATGLLHLELGGMKKVVYLREGSPIFVRSNLLRECLGQLLIRDGVISSVQCDDSLRRVRESGRRQGRVLVEMGLLTPDELDRAITRQVTEKLLEVFAWPEGTYRFITVRDFKTGTTAVELPPARMILEGVRRYFPPHRTAQLLLAHRSAYPLPTPSPPYPAETLGLSPADAEILSCCRGELTVQDLLDRTPRSRRQTEQLLAVLLLTGVLESRTERSRLPQGALDALTAAARGAGDDAPPLGEGEAQEAFKGGLASMRGHRFAEALEVFERLLRHDPVNPEYLACHAWAMYKADPGKAQKAREALQDALRINPRLDTAHLYLGRILQALGRHRDAERSFESAVKANPRCSEAARELRLVQMRREKSQGFLDRILRK